MANLIAENSRKTLDHLGRLTLPKGMRDRLGLVEGTVFEFYTGEVDGRKCVCLMLPEDEDVIIQRAVKSLKEIGVKYEDLYELFQ